MDVLTAVDPDRIASDIKSGHEFWLDVVDPTDDEVERVGALLDASSIDAAPVLDVGDLDRLVIDANLSAKGRDTTE